MSDNKPTAPDPKYSVAKGVWKGVKTAAIVLGPLVLQQAANEGTLTGLLPTKYQGLAAVIAGLARFLLNRNKHA